jgi:hypothetical protein
MVVGIREEYGYQENIVLHYIIYPATSRAIDENNSPGPSLPAPLLACADALGWLGAGAGAELPRLRSEMNRGTVPTTGSYVAGSVVLSWPFQHHVSKHDWHSLVRLASPPYALSAMAHARHRGHDSTVPFNVSVL